MAATTGSVDVVVALSGTIGEFATSAGAVDNGVAFALSAVAVDDGVPSSATTGAVDVEVA